MLSYGNGRLWIAESGRVLAEGVTLDEAANEFPETTITVTV